MTATSPFPDRIRRELDRLVPPPTGAADGLLVALSGGPDSTALLRVAAAWARDAGRPLAAAHFHHGLRGADADADASFCRGLCAGLDVPLHLDGTTSLGPDAGEDEARRRRRRFLLAVLDENRLAVCATGHHLDDQAETVLMRLCRGAGARGLQGIRPRAGRFVHPLLPATREEIVVWLREIGQSWREDASNRDGDNLRARMRRRLWPVLRDLFGPAALHAPARAAELLREDAEALDGISADLLAAWRADGVPEEALPLAPLLAQPAAVQSRLFRCVLAGGPGETPVPEARHLRDLLAWLPLAQSGAERELPGGLTVRREFDLVRCLPPPAGRLAGVVTLSVRPASRTELASRLPEAGLNPGTVRWRLTCPADALTGAPRLRPWREGDRLTPLGMDGRKKVSDLLRERRVPLSRRGEVLVATDARGPFWVVGLCRDERTRLLPTTEQGITLQVERLDGTTARPPHREEGSDAAPGRGPSV